MHAAITPFATSTNAAAGGHLREERSIMKKGKPSTSKRRASSRRCGHLAENGDHSLQSWTIGALPIVDHLLKRMKLEEFLAHYLPTEDGRTKLPTAGAGRLGEKRPPFPRAAVRRRRLGGPP